jgi:hypothetical protein
MRRLDRVAPPVRPVWAPAIPVTAQPVPLPLFCCPPSVEVLDVASMLLPGDFRSTILARDGWLVSWPTTSQFGKVLQRLIISLVGFLTTDSRLTRIHSELSPQHHVSRWSSALMPIFPTLDRVVPLAGVEEESATNRNYTENPHARKHETRIGASKRTTAFSVLLAIFRIKTCRPSRSRCTRHPPCKLRHPPDQTVLHDALYQRTLRDVRTPSPSGRARTIRLNRSWNKFKPNSNEQFKSILSRTCQRLFDTGLEQVVPRSGQLEQVKSWVPFGSVEDMIDTFSEIKKFNSRF